MASYQHHLFKCGYSTAGHALMLVIVNCNNDVQTVIMMFNVHIQLHIEQLGYRYAIEYGH